MIRAAAPGEDRRLNGNVVVRALIDATADVGVLALGVFAKHEHVDRAGGLASQRAVHAVVQIRGTETDALIEAPANREEQPVQRDVVLDSGMPDRAEQHRVELRQFIEELGRSHPSVGEVVIGPPRKLGPLDARADFRDSGLGGAHRFASDFGTDAVSGNDGDAMCGHDGSCSRFVRRIRQWFHPCLAVNVATSAILDGADSKHNEPGDQRPPGSPGRTKPH